MAPEPVSLIRDWLASEVGVRVATGGRPRNAKPPFVTIERTGTYLMGQQVDNVDRPVVTVTSWAASAPEARQLDMRVRAAMRHINERDYFTAPSVDTSSYDDVDDGPIYQTKTTFEVFVAKAD